MATLQDQPANARQVRNNAGGFVYEITPEQRLMRWLIMGASGTYYVDKVTLTVENADNIRRLVTTGKGMDVVKAAVEVSVEGRAAKQDYALFALAMAEALGDGAVREAVLRALPKVCRTASTLFQFLDYIRTLGAVRVASSPLTAEGCSYAAVVSDKAKPPKPPARLRWGRRARAAFSSWYLAQDPMDLAYQITKYRNRNGWTHRDVLRLAHPRPAQAPKLAAPPKRKAQGQPAAASCESAVAEVAQATAGLKLTDSPVTATTIAPAAESAAPAEKRRKVKGSTEDKVVAEGGVGTQRVLAMRAVLAYAANDAVPEALAAQVRSQGAAGGRVESAEPPAGHAPDVKVEEEVSAGSAGTGTTAAQGSGEAVRVLDYLSAAERLRTGIKAFKPAPPSPAADAVAEAAAPADSMAVEQAAPAPKEGAGAEEGEAAKPLSKRQARRQAFVERAWARRGRGRRGARFAPPLHLLRGMRAGGSEGGSDSEGAGEGDEKAKKAGPELDEEAVAEAVALIKQWRFGHEHVGDQGLLKSPAVWGAFLDLPGGMPMTALVRSLGRMSAVGVLDDSARRAAVVSKLTSPGAVAAARLHPITLLSAFKVYGSGHGEKGSLSWTPHPEVTAALEQAFYLSFKTLTPTGKRFVIGMDVSGSMSCAAVTGMPHVTAREAVCAITMALVRAEGRENVRLMAFSSNFVEVQVSPEDKLDALMRRTERMPFDGTDCSLPMQWAMKEKVAADAFIVLTDNETYSGRMHPVEALRAYRSSPVGVPDAKLIVLATSVSSFTIADPSDPGMLDVAGLDSAVPRLVSEFVTNKL